MSVMTEEQILSSIIPEPKLEQITLETTSDKKIRVTIKFSISDVVPVVHLFRKLVVLEDAPYFRVSRHCCVYLDVCLLQ